MRHRDTKRSYRTLCRLVISRIIGFVENDQRGTSCLSSRRCRGRNCGGRRRYSSGIVSGCSSTRLTFFGTSRRHVPHFTAIEAGTSVHSTLFLFSSELPVFGEVRGRKGFGSDRSRSGYRQGSRFWSGLGRLRPSFLGRGVRMNNLIHLVVRPISHIEAIHPSD